MNESIALSIKFLTEVKGFKQDNKGTVIADDHYKKIVWECFSKLIDGGMNVKEMYSLMDEYKAECSSAHEAFTMDDIYTYFNLKAQKRIREIDPDNLLQYGLFYYHPALQIIPPPPIIDVRPDGTFIPSHIEKFYLEIKDRFTIEDLIRYYYKRIPTRRNSLERDIGIVKHLLKSYPLEILLYSIDEASVQEEYPRTMFDIQEYITQAELILQDRMNTSFEAGIDHVIPR